MSSWEDMQWEQERRNQEQREQQIHNVAETEANALGSEKPRRNSGDSGAVKWIVGIVVIYGVVHWFDLITKQFSSGQGDGREAPGTYTSPVTRGSPKAVPVAREQTPLRVPKAVTSNQGTDPSRPVFGPGDEVFLDWGRGRGGLGATGWGERCVTNIKAGKLGWAEAECLEGLQSADGRAGKPRATLLYDLGIIEERAGNKDGACDKYSDSLDIVETTTVQTAYDRLKCDK
jgi:hypothetical protein